MKILLACERSAGHIFPALSFAKKFSLEGSNNISFFVTSAALKKHIKESRFLVVGKIFSFRNLLIESIWRFFEAFYLIFKLRPAKVIGLGGRDSFFLVLFSSLFFIDTAIYEPNVKMGKANKVLSYFVKKVLRGFEVGKKSRKIVNIGIILRENIKKIDKSKARSILGFDQRPVIFCFGGSQGSSFINNVFIRFIQEFKTDCQVIHLTGKSDYFKIFPLYNKLENNKFIKDFYYDVQILYSAADVVISRAGASTLAEIVYYELPSILIPHPQAGAHQEHNAFYLKERNSAFVSLQEDFSFDDFQKKLSQLIYDNSLRQELRGNLKKVKIGVSFEDFCNNVYL